MKRQLSLVLALVMILGTFTTVFAADTSTDAITEASTFLKDKGVLVGNMNGDLMLGENLSRQDTAILVSRLMGEYDVAKDFPTAENIPTYEDIKDNFYLPVLAWAQANKTFVGHSNARFGFDDNVTAQEYSKVLLVALGYEVGPETNLDLTWEATLQKAKDLGILKNINDDIKNTDEITRGEMAVMTFNALSVMMKDGTKTLAEKLNIVMPAATKLTAEVKDTMNLKEVVINLSNVKLADADKLMDVANYRIDGVKVKDVTVDGNDVILLLEESLVKGREYKLTVANIETGLNGSYNFKAADNTLPTVETVTVLGEYGIKVTTSEPIRDAKERNFLVDGRNVSMNIEMYGRDLILTPYYNESFPSNATTLTIKEIEDYAGLKATERDFDIKIVRDDVAPKVTDVVSRGNKVEVTFDKDIYEKSVEDYGGRTSTGNISYQSGRQTIYATDANKVDTNKVVYTFEREIPRRTSVTISGVQNHSKVTMASVTQMPREELDYSEPEIIDKKVSTTETTAEITLKFNKNVEGILKAGSDKEFVVNRHFTLYEKDVYRGEEKNLIDSAEYDVDRDGKIIKDTVIVKLSGLKEYNSKDDNNYVLEVENFTDETSVRNIMYRDYVDFKATAKSIFEVKDVDVYDGKGRNDSEITIEFNRSVDKVAAEQNTNYLFDDGSDNLKDVKELKGSVYAEKDGKIVTIILPKDVRVDEFNTMTILNSLKDKDGNRLAKSVEYDFATDVFYTSTDSKVDLLAAKAASAEIAKLPALNQISLDDKAAVVSALSAYNNLTPAQKLLVSDTIKNKVVAADKKIVDLEAVQTVDGLITALPAAGNVALTDKDQIEAARKAYDALTPAQRLLVKDLASLEAAEAELSILEAPVNVEKLITELPEATNITLANKAKVVEARTAYNKLSAIQKSVVNNYAKLQAAEAKILTIEKANADIAKAKANIEKATYTATQTEANDEANAKNKAIALVNDLELEGVTVAVQTVTFTQATGGNNGSYTFVVNLSKTNGAPAVTALQTMTITTVTP